MCDRQYDSMCNSHIKRAAYSLYQVLYCIIIFVLFFNIFKLNGFNCALNMSSDWWETLTDSHMEYMSAKNRAILVWKNGTF